MRLQFLQNSLNNNGYNSNIELSNFKARGKPITLEYIVKKRSYLLPKRVLDKAQVIVARMRENKPSLKELHLDIYAPLLECKTLDEAKHLFPEFSDIKEDVIFQRNSRYAEEFKMRTDKDFSLKILQEYWGKLRNKDDIAHDLGMKGRSSLDWVLKKIGFVPLDTNYKILIKASDEEENRLIAAKTTAWNVLHPDLMFLKNRKAAQGCKTEKYRKEQSQRIKDYDKEHPERREKIRIVTQRAWDSCPEIKKAMSDFLLELTPAERCVIVRSINKKCLSSKEKVIRNKFFKDFWTKYSNLKSLYAEAMKKNKKP